MSAKKWVVGLAAVLVLVGVGKVQAEIFQTVGFSALQNFRWQDNSTMMGAPTGNVNLGGVPFSIPVAGNNAWHAHFASGPDPRSIDISVNVFGVREVHTLINTYWGQPGPDSYATLEFFGSDDGYFKKDLVGDVDIRDYAENPTTTNLINGTTTIEVWTRWRRLDKQQLVLPGSFADETLVTMRLSDNGNNAPSRVVLYGVTVSFVPEPSPIVTSQREIAHSHCFPGSEPQRAGRRSPRLGQGCRKHVVRILSLRQQGLRRHAPFSRGRISPAR